MKRLFINIILLAVSMTAFGQQFIGVKLNGGLSYIKNEYSLNFNVTQKFYPMLSGQGGLTYNYVFKNKLSIGTEILFMQIKGKNYLEYPSGNIYIGTAKANGTATADNGYSHFTNFEHIYYVGLPVYIGYNYRRLNVNIGIQANLALAAVSKAEGQMYHEGKLYDWNDKEDFLDGINRFNYGGRIGLFYKLSDKLSFETNYYYGLNGLELDKKAEEIMNTRIQQCTVGLRYNLFVSARQNHNTNTL